MIYRRELVCGAIGYLVGAAILRWAPLPFTIPTTFTAEALAIALASMIIFGGLATWIGRRRPSGQRLASAASLALPVLLGDAVETTIYPSIYPHFDPASSGVFAAILLFTNLAMVSAGWIADQRASNVHTA